MLVYGDHQELAEPWTRARDIDGQLRNITEMRPGLERHARLVAVLVEVGQLLQGIADSAWARDNVDRRTESTAQLSAFLLDLGRAVVSSWDSAFSETGPLPTLQIDWPNPVELRLPEGFAFYAVYPEAYADAARRLKLGGAPRVIGIRSIGTSLAAVVAAVLGAPPPVTVRPIGDPYDRKIAIDPALERELLAGAYHYVIVDEGPGQSGSSFAAVGEWLERRGVPRDRIVVVTSHAGAPGAAAPEARREWWRQVQRQVGDFSGRWPAHIGCWCATLLGLLDEPPREISAGEWRRLSYTREEDWPAVVPAWERRKFLVTAGGERFLVKFAGLGRIAEEKLAVARALQSEGFGAEPIGLAHGFLIERWHEDAVPLKHGENPLAEIGRYIGTRAALLPAPGGSGASIQDLLTMARRNVSLELGDGAARALEPWQTRASELERRVVRVRTDNRLDRHEWLRTASGALLKTDALDHYRAHDLIGCQDLAWDAAGAIVEFEMSDERELIGPIEASAGRGVDPVLLAFYGVAYLAFRLGQARLGTTMVSDADEQRRLQRRGDRYGARLPHLLQHAAATTRPKSLIG